MLRYTNDVIRGEIKDLTNNAKTGVIFSQIFSKT